MIREITWVAVVVRILVAFLLGGILGGITATAGLVIPSIIVIVIIAGFLKAFSENKYVKNVFYGIRPIVTSIVLFSVYGIISQTVYLVQSKS